MQGKESEQELEENVSEDEVPQGEEVEPEPEPEPEEEENSGEPEEEEEVPEAPESINFVSFDNETKISETGFTFMFGSWI